MANALRIGVNALYLIPGGVGGTEIYLRNLLEALSEIDCHNQYYVFVNSETAKEEELPVVPCAPNFSAEECPLRGVNRPWRLLWEQLALPFQTRARRLDVLFCPGFTSPLIGGGRKVTVIHDMQHKRQPQNFGPVELLAWRALVWVSAHFSQEIITVSEHSRRNILETYAVPAERVHVVRHGVEPAFFARRQPRPEEVGDWPYLLAVSTIHPHKNWDRLLEAFQRLAEAGFPHHLVIAGLKGNYFKQLEGLIQAAGMRQRVHATGWVPRGVLLGLFQHADALVFPSTFEGFGMPVLEAMAAGIPVACSDIPPLREAAGDAALFFDPYSVEAMATAVRRLLTEPGLRQELAGRGRQNAANFTWTRAAEETLGILERAAAR